MLQVQVWRNILLVSTSSVERSRVGKIPEILVHRVCLPLPQLIASLARNKVKDIGAHIPAAEGIEIPVGLNGGNLRVVVVEAVVGCANEMLGNSITEKNTEDVVLAGVGFVFIPSDKNKSVIHEVLILEEWLKKGARPVSSDSNRSVLVLLEIPVEHGVLSIHKREILDLRKSLFRSSYAVVKNSWVVLANVVVLSILVVHPCETFKACVGHVFLVKTPGDTSMLKEINDG
ncbi:hypothetical protein HG531_004680 [Fusarium graminearum]|nr:hypothetical protein HG531_004680 [Fusarium graminearum]